MATVQNIYASPDGPILVADGNPRVHLRLNSEGAVKIVVGNDMTDPTAKRGIVLETGKLDEIRFDFLEDGDMVWIQSLTRQPETVLVTKYDDPFIAWNINPITTFDQVEATGGDLTYDITDDEGRKWRVHEFLSSGIFDVTSPGFVECVLVAGGAGGGAYSNSGGGGGAGGVPNLGKPIGMYFETGQMPITVGAGGSAGISTSRNGGKGSNTQIEHRLFAYGGGSGTGYQDAINNYDDGGSGGGGQSFDLSSWTRNSGSGYEGQGNSGGGGGYNYGSRPYAGGGGGGAGTPGLGVNYTDNLGHGGDGVPVNITGTERWFGGGGAGGHQTEQTNGGLGGGGSKDGVNPLEGQVNTGGGGSAAYKGGSGIAILRYRISDIVDGI